MASVERGNDNHAVWLDVTGSTQAEIEAIGKKFGVHPLAVEDARKRQQRPKVDEYDDHLFVVLYAVDPPRDHGRITLNEVSIFITRREVVTIHRSDVPEIEIAARRWADHCGRSNRQDPYMLAYTIADTVVDGYFPTADAIGERIDLLEDEMFASGGAQTLQDVVQLKRQLLELRRVVAPTRDVFNSFTRLEMPILGEHSLVYFQDVYDHVIRVTDSIDAYRDILSSVTDIHLTLVSNKLNETLRTLTVASIVLMTLALIAGIYGMNFHLTPSGDWEYGFESVLVSMVVIGLGLGAWFRHKHWI